MPTRTHRLATLSTAVAAALLLVGDVAAAAAADVDPVGRWPLAPRPAVVAGFDPPESPFGPGHRGVDLAGRPGQVVRAALPGRVSFVGSVAGRPVVTVDHGATRTTYEPVTSTAARGERVVAGSPIGTLAVTGSHCLPQACLHWGWLRGETYLDPLRLVGGGPVRLLPLAGLPSPGGPAAGAVRARAGPYAAWAPVVARPPAPWVLRPGGAPAGRPGAAGPW